MGPEDEKLPDVRGWLDRLKKTCKTAKMSDIKNLVHEVPLTCRRVHSNRMCSSGGRDPASSKTFNDFCQKYIYSIYLYL